MIDLETMGIRPTSAIVSIGVCLFDDIKIVDTFYTPVNLQSCRDVGLTTDKSTEEWWQKQSAEARAAWQTSDAPRINEALKSMNDWMLQRSPVSVCRPWGNGADFDLTIIGYAFNAIEANPPWKFYNHACFRTMKNMFDVPVPQRLGTHHHALDDAIHQATHLQLICKTYGISLD